MSIGRRFRYGDTTVAVTSDTSAVLDWLAEFLAPSFEILPFPPAADDRTVDVRHDADRYERVAGSRPAGALSTVACFVRDAKTTRRPAWSWQGASVIGEDRLGALYVMRERSVEILPAPTAPRPRTAIMRVVRELAVAPTLLDPRRVLLHASAVEHDGRAIVFAGPRECGKTTMLALVARAGDAAILGNDRVMLTTIGDTWEARGVPTIVSVRQGTRDLVPELAGLPRAAAPVELRLEECGPVSAAPRVDGPAPADARRKVTPRQFAAALAASLAGQARLGAIVFPEPLGDDAAVVIERLGAETALARLGAARFGAHAGADAPTVFAGAHGTRPAGADAAACTRLAATTPCFVVRVGRRAFRDGATGRRVVAGVLG